ncbi:hypothetical protein Tco_0959055 [Tanacetum coccineum]
MFLNDLLKLAEVVWSFRRDNGGEIHFWEKEVNCPNGINYGEDVVIKDGNKVEGPMMMDLIQLRSSLNISNTSRTSDDREGDDREFVVIGDVGEVLFSGGEGGDLLEDDIETLRGSERCIREVVIEIKKNVVYIEKFLERHGVEEQRFLGVFGLERKDWLDLVGIGSKLQKKRRQENIVVPLKAVPYISGGPIYIREPPNI